MRGYCPHCAKITAVHTRTRLESYVVRGEPVEVEHHFTVCTTCRQEFATAEQAEIGLAVAQETYRRSHRLVTPEEIVRIRSRYAAGQRAFGIVLGFGAATINSYEQGELPTDASSNLIRLAEDAAVFARLFQERASLLGPTQRKRIEKRIKNLISSPDSASTGYRITDAGGILCSEVPDEYRGFRAPDAERLYALLAAILVCLDTPVFKTKLLKLAFLAELEYFRACTVSISGWPYARLPFGPVPQNYKLILSAAESEGYLTSQDQEDGTVVFSAGTGARSDVLAAHLGRRELDVIRSVAAAHRTTTAAELTRITHALAAWRKTEHAGLISYALALE